MVKDSFENILKRSLDSFRADDTLSV